jgi:hypothetical protein
MAENLVARTALLDEREQALRQRERELAEQRRILAEEYRLLRARHATPAAVGRNLGSTASAPRPRPARLDTGANQGFWAWVKRVMLGSSAPTVEGG